MNPSVTWKHFEALFLLAGIPVVSFYEIKNQYWPDDSRYDSVRTPWFIVETPYGFIKLGWRKRVIEIDWSSTKMSFQVTQDNVTKENFLVHAWEYSKAVQYLTTLGSELRGRAARNEMKNGI